MAGSVDMQIVRVGGYAFKVRPKDVDDFLERHPGAEVAGGNATKSKTKPAAKKATKEDGKE